MNPSFEDSRHDLWRWLNGESGLLDEFEDDILEYGSVEKHAAALREKTFYTDWKPHVEDVLFDAMCCRAHIWIESDCDNHDIHSAWWTHELIRIIENYDAEVGADLRSFQRKRYREAVDTDRSHTH